MGFYGMRPVSTGLIAASLMGLMMICLFGAGSIKDFAQTAVFAPKPLILFAALMVLTNIKKVKDLHPILFIAVSAVIGIIFNYSE